MNRSTAKEIVVNRPNIVAMRIRLIGTSPLLTCRKGEHELEKIKAAAPGKKTTAKKGTVLSPDEQYESHRYIIDKKRDGIPASAVKGAMVSAVRMLKTSGNTDLSMVAFKPMVTVLPVGHHKLMEIKCSRRERDDDWGVIPSRQVPIPVYRPIYHDWSCECVVQFDEDLISPDTVLNLLMKAGQVGIGAYRPECNGTNGMFEVEQVHEKKKRKK